MGKLNNIDPEEIRKLYWDDGLSLSEIAKTYNVSSAFMFRFMKRHGITRRSKSDAGKVLAKKTNIIKKEECIDFQASMKPIIDEIKQEGVTEYIQQQNSVSMPINLIDAKQERGIEMVEQELLAPTTTRG